MTYWWLIEHANADQRAEVDKQLAAKLAWEADDELAQFTAAMEV